MKRKAMILGVSTELDSLFYGSVTRVADWFRENEEALKKDSHFSEDEIDSTLNVLAELDEQLGNLEP